MRFHFVESGILRVYYYKDGKEVTAWFAFKGMTASCIDSLFSGAETSYYIDVVEDERNQRFLVLEVKICAIIKKRITSQPVKPGHCFIMP
jgi:hypothetical protein